jgi:hypothetical protein
VASWASDGAEGGGWHDTEDAGSGPAQTPLDAQMEAGRRAATAWSAVAAAVP